MACLKKTMTAIVQTNNFHAVKLCRIGAPISQARQSGVVLVIALIVLLMVSLIGAVAIRGSSSSEQVANSARTENLARQAAEAALRFCEIGAQNWHFATRPPGFTLSPTRPTYQLAIANEPATGIGDWQNLTTWDSTTPRPTTIVVVGLDQLDAMTLTPTATTASATVNFSTFSALLFRPPECMMQYTDASHNLAWITARGFGPDVQPLTGTTRNRPNGTEVFVQSTLGLP